MLEPPPTLYVGIYRANMVRPEADIPVISEKNVRVTFSRGEFGFSISVPEMHYEPPSMSMTVGVRQVGIPPGAYVVVESVIVDAKDRDAEMESALLVAEAVGLLHLRYGIIKEKVYEGYVNPPNGMVLVPEGGSIQLSPRQPTPPVEMGKQLATDLLATRALAPEVRGRLRLAARWFVRAETTRQPIDRFLMLWTVLEVFPMKDTSDIRPISHLLAAKVVPQLPAEEIKTRLEIGRMCKVRCDIVHDGKAFVGSAEQMAFEDLLTKLGAVAEACLRVLAELPLGGVLDRWIPTVA